VLEIKCPFTALDSCINNSSVPYLVWGINGLDLRKDHDYYYQIQGQMLCTDKQSCDFVVFTQIDFKIIQIERDDCFLDTMQSTLSDFFNNYFRLALLEKYLYKNSSKYTFQY